ncbi:MAG: NADPH-dependent 7-cyano-7-deazaguanine reductase QueF [Oxalobacter formigenes]|nr:NADPH-dependent 7-cyano-7-deazaguanine reductase QueF [Oxalobacter formigenes]
MNTPHHTPPDANTPAQSPLGKPAAAPSAYDPAVLYPIPRKSMRDNLDIAGTLPFYGLDIWNAYELSWLNMRGKPQIAIMNLTVSADSPNIVESKSMKLYLNSLAQTRLAGADAVSALLRADLSDAFGSPVTVSLIQQPAFASVKIEELGGILLDRLDIEATQYSRDPSLLKTNTEEPPVEEKLVSHLLRTNCPVTGQPDWGSIQIHYVGHAINQEGLLKYLISYRTEQEFHEQCVERIFLDILKTCRPQGLTVYARYTRRGGISINPWRSNTSSGKRPLFIRNARQ